MGLSLDPSNKNTLGNPKLLIGTFLKEVKHNLNLYRDEIPPDPHPSRSRNSTRLALFPQCMQDDLAPVKWVWVGCEITTQN